MERKLNEKEIQVLIDLITIEALEKATAEKARYMNSLLQALLNANEVIIK